MKKEKYREEGTVLSQEEISDGIFSLWIQTEEIAKAAVPGQFINIYCKEGSRLLPRPISICEIDRECGTLRLVYRIVGKGTREFSGYQKGDTISLLGPLGNGFPLKGTKALLIGGGIGIPPMLQLAKELSCETTVAAGYRDGQLFLKEDFEKYAAVCVATEDGSVGTKGNVIDAIREHQVEADVIYACGPAPMLSAVKAYGEEKGIETYVSLEERMACGIGACLACVCQSTEKDSHTNVKNKRVCKEGPVFLAQQVEITR